jgi:hypothetical protein
MTWSIQRLSCTTYDSLRQSQILTLIPSRQCSAPDHPHKKKQYPTCPRTRLYPPLMKGASTPKNEAVPARLGARSLIKSFDPLFAKERPTRDISSSAYSPVHSPSCTRRGKNPKQSLSYSKGLGGDDPPWEIAFIFGRRRRQRCRLGRTLRCRGRHRRGRVPRELALPVYNERCVEAHPPARRRIRDIDPRAGSMGISKTI